MTGGDPAKISRDSIQVSIQVGVNALDSRVDKEAMLLLYAGTISMDGTRSQEVIIPVRAGLETLISRKSH